MECHITFKSGTPMAKWRIGSAAYVAAKWHHFFEACKMVFVYFYVRPKYSYHVCGRV
jgi:hypothetical protein